MGLKTAFIHIEYMFSSASPTAKNHKNIYGIYKLRTAGNSHFDDNIRVYQLDFMFLFIVYYAARAHDWLLLKLNPKIAGF